MKAFNVAYEHGNTQNMVNDEEFNLSSCRMKLNIRPTPRLVHVLTVSMVREQGGKLKWPVPWWLLVLDGST